MPPNRTMLMLLAEDDDDHAELVLRSLRKNPSGARMERVRDGVEALAYLRREAPFEKAARPDLVLLDMNMPRMGGIEALTIIKEDQDLRAIPVVMLTTSDAESDRANAYRHHVNSYLVKPVEFQQFRKLIEEISVYWGVWNRPPS